MENKYYTIHIPVSDRVSVEVMAECDEDAIESAVELLEDEMLRINGSSDLFNLLSDDAEIMNVEEVS
jgi:hypothetical protein